MPNRQALAGHYFLLASHVEIALWLFGSHGSVMAASLRGTCCPGSKLCQIEPFLFSSALVLARAGSDGAGKALGREDAAAPRLRSQPSSQII